MKIKTCIPISVISLLLLASSLSPAATVEYTYKPDGRLSKADYGGIAFNYEYDLVGNILTRDIEILSTYDGDLDNNGNVELTDSILALQVMSGIKPPQMVHRNSDIDADGKLGMGEALFIMTTISEQ